MKREREKDNEGMRKVGEDLKENGGWKENRNSKIVRKRRRRTKKRQRLWRETEKRERWGQYEKYRHRKS